MTTELAEINDLWTEAEEHMQAAAHYARRTVEEAWLAGDVLVRIRAQLPHGAWMPALRERGVAVRTAQRFVQLRQKYPEMRQIGAFATVSAALSDKTEIDPDKSTSAAPVVYVIDGADFWDWEWDQLSPLAKKHLTNEEQGSLEGAILDVLWEYERDHEEGPQFDAAWGMFRQALACFVDVGPLEGNAAAAEETERRLSAFLGRGNQ